MDDMQKVMLLLFKANAACAKDTALAAMIGAIIGYLDLIQSVHAGGEVRSALDDAYEEAEEAVGNFCAVQRQRTSETPVSVVSLAMEEHAELEERIEAIEQILKERGGKVFTACSKLVEAEIKKVNLTVERRIESAINPRPTRDEVERMIDGHVVVKTVAETQVQSTAQKCWGSAFSTGLYDQLRTSLLAAQEEAGDDVVIPPGTVERLLREAHMSLETPKAITAVPEESPQEVEQTVSVGGLRKVPEPVLVPKVMLVGDTAVDVLRFIIDNTMGDVQRVAGLGKDCTEWYGKYTPSSDRLSLIRPKMGALFSYVGLSQASVTRAWEDLGVITGNHLDGFKVFGKRYRGVILNLRKVDTLLTAEFPDFDSTILYPFWEFFSEHCVLGGPETTEVSSVHLLFNEWAQWKGYAPIKSSQWFGKFLLNIGLAHFVGNSRFVQGIKVLFGAAGAPVVDLIKSTQNEDQSVGLTVSDVVATDSMHHKYATALDAIRFILDKTMGGVNTVFGLRAFNSETLWYCYYSKHKGCLSFRQDLLEELLALGGFALKDMVATWKLMGVLNDVNRAHRASFKIATGSTANRYYGPVVNLHKTSVLLRAVDPEYSSAHLFPFDAFFKEECVLGGKDLSVNMHAAFNAWAVRKKYDVFTPNLFGRYMRSLGFAFKRIRRQWVVYGIRLRTTSVTGIPIAPKLPVKSIVEESTAIDALRFVLEAVMSNPSVVQGLGKSLDVTGWYAKYVPQLQSAKFLVPELKELLSLGGFPFFDIVNMWQKMGVANSGNRHKNFRVGTRFFVGLEIWFDKAEIVLSAAYPNFDSTVLHPYDAFFTDLCVMDDTAEIRLSVLRVAFNAWATRMGYATITNATKFGKYVHKALGLSCTVKHNFHYLSGIKLFDTVSNEVPVIVVEHAPPVVEVVDVPEPPIVEVVAAPPQTVPKPRTINVPSSEDVPNAVELPTTAPKVPRVQKDSHQQRLEAHIGGLCIDLNNGLDVCEKLMVNFNMRTGDLLRALNGKLSTQDKFKISKSGVKEQNLSEEGYKVIKDAFLGCGAIVLGGRFEDILIIPHMRVIPLFVVRTGMLHTLDYIERCGIPLSGMPFKAEVVMQLEGPVVKRGILVEYANSLKEWLAQYVVELPNE